MGRADELMELLPAALRQEDEALKALTGLLDPFARVEAYFDLRRRKLAYLLDPSKVPDDQVKHLAALVGVGLDLPAANLATTAELRKLTAVAVALWKRKGTSSSWRSVVAALVGKRVLILDWFYLRLVFGTSGELHTIPAPGSTASGNYDYPEFVSDLWYMDPEGTANTALLLAFLDLCRASNERINVYLGLFVDDALAGWGSWDLSGPGTSSDSTTVGALTLSDDRLAVATVGGDELAWAGYHAHLRLAGSGSPEIRVGHQDAENSYVLVLDEAGSEVRLYREEAAVRTLLGTAAAALVADAPYRWSLDFIVSGAGTRVRALVEASPLLDVLDAGSAITAGTVAFYAPASGNVSLTSCLVFEIGTSPTRVGLSP